MLKNNKKGYILIEIAIFIIIISVFCISLSIIIANKISLNQKDKYTQNLYITAKSTLNILSEEFLENKSLLKEYAKKNESGNLIIENREDISSVCFNLFETNDKKFAILEVTVTDNFKNQITLKTEIKY